MAILDLKKSIQESLRGLDLPEGDFVLEHPDELQHGDYSTNAALVFAKKLKVKPNELAEKIISKLQEENIPHVEKIEMAGPGFINFHLSKDFFTESIQNILKNPEMFGMGKSDEKVMIEYTNPNPFKQLHIGHVMSNTVGEALSRLIGANGAEVKRACYGGDVGLHVAKAIWGMKRDITGKPKDKESLSKKAAYLGSVYTAGANAYEDDESAKKEINALNKVIFEKSDKDVNKLYEWGKEVSLAHFEEMYEKLGTKFDYYFFESEVAPLGVFLVEEFLAKGIFEKSEGAIVFKGEKYGLHTRVFINSEGLPTYEAKELGLNKKKKELYPFDLSLILTANEQTDYFRVLLKVMEFVYPEIANKTRHIAHGFLKFADGKMSSRKGNVVTAESLISDVEKLVEEKIKDREFDKTEREEVKEIVAIGAIKYSILKQAPGSDIIFDFEKSISFEGDSGPYLQYACVRAKSVLEKAKTEGIDSKKISLEGEISTLEKILYRFPEIVERAGREYAPNILTTYLTELASAFNAFYAQEQIVSKTDPASPYKVAITEAFSIVLERGLNLLGIETPEKM